MEIACIKVAREAAHEIADFNLDAVVAVSDKANRSNVDKDDVNNHLQCLEGKKPA